MGGGVNPNWWSIRPSIPPVTSTITSYQQHQQHHPPYYNLLLYPPNNNTFMPFNSTPHQPASSSSNSSSWLEHDNHHQILQDNGQQQHPTDTWSQLLLNRMDQDEGEKQSAASARITPQFQLTSNKLKLQIWEQRPVMLQQQEHHLHDLNCESNSQMDIKHEHHAVPSSCYEMFGHGNEEFLDAKTTAVWSSIVMPNSSPQKSCVTSFVSRNNSMLDFSSNKKGNELKHPAPDHQSAESNSSATGGASKKARVQPSPPQSANTIKVRKEKLVDRITALHQLVSPFGKTDTASVLLETMGYIRFLQSQIEALSLPYLGRGSSSTRQQQLHMHAQGESICIFPEDPAGQLLNDHCSIKRKADLQLQLSEKDPKGLRNRGLCLVSVTLRVGAENGTDCWAPSLQFFGGGFRR